MNRIRPLPLLALFVVGLSVILSGCTTPVKPDSVSVTVADVKMADATVMETRVVVSLRFTSESLNPFGFSGSSHKLFFNGQYVGRAVNNQPFGMPPLSTTMQDVTLVLENTALLKQALSMRNNPVVKYRLESVLFSTRGDDDMKLKTSSEGTLDLSALEAAAGRL